VNILGILSGKGGTGKTTVCTNLALALSKKKKKVGVFDADITGSNVITALGDKIDKPISIDGENVIPAQINGVQAFSTDLYKTISRDKGAPLMRPGAWKSNYIMDVFMSMKFDVDYLLIDFPPGVDDHSQKLLQSLTNMKAIVITTPDLKSLENVKDCLRMLKYYKIPVLGLVETMKTYEYREGKKVKHLPLISGPDVKEYLNLKVLESIPFKPNLKPDDFSKLAGKLEGFW
jgi:ATP-binding protein involved in chromosome partitioning